jgi:hypothetical protein
MSMEWIVVFATTKVEKTARDAKKLPPKAQEKLFRLIHEIRESGPIQPMWPHYSELVRQSWQRSNEKRYHCHILGRRYVACWRVIDKQVFVEVYYVGTHENAPY